MGEVAKVDYSGLRKAFDRYQNATKRDIKKVIKAQCKPLIRDLVKLTPPTGRAPFTESLNEQRRAGETAIRNDLNKIFTPILECSMVKHPKNLKLAEQIKALAEKNKTRKLQDLFVRLGIETPVVDKVTEEYHRQALDAHNRPRKNVEVFYVKKAGSVKLMRELIRRVGIAKSGWVPSAEKFNLALPAWIKRHAGNGRVRSWLDNPFSIRVTFFNDVSYIKKHNLRNRIIQRALDRRVESMNNQLDKILGQQFKGYGKSGKYAKVTK